MKKLLTAITLFPVLTFAALPTSNNVTVPVEHVYSPAGFDNNDEVEVAVTGFLPNLCYQAPKSFVKITGEKISVTMKATYRNVQTPAFCVNIRVPYTEYVKVGVLDKGNYKVAVNESSQWESVSNLYIAEASSNSIDEVVYASVDEIVRPSLESRKVILKGYNPSDCFELKEIAIQDNGKDTYSVLPKMKQVRASCPKKMIPFAYEFEVPQKLEADKILLHVRVMDGRSVNAFFSDNLEF